MKQRRGNQRGQPKSGKPPSSRAPRQSRTVCLLTRRGRFLTAEPFFARGRRINLGARQRSAREGDLVLLSETHRGPARIERKIGSPDVARDVIEAWMLSEGLSRRFPKHVEREAKLVVFDDNDPAPNRHDLRSLPTFTIDPSQARDFDDAISAGRQDDGTVRVWVHIADVASYVRPGSTLDREAYDRATSVYLPGAVEPMLPPELSNDVCSLRPNQDRRAVTAELDFRGAELVRSAFYRSLIRSDVRLDYDQVDRIFAGEENLQGVWSPSLAIARAVAHQLDVVRHQQGALAIESLEPEFVFSDRGDVESVTQTKSSEAHRLIEYLMIAANEAVATLLESRSLPTLYRVHDRPDPDRVEQLIDQLASLGLPTPPIPKQLSPAEAGDVVAHASRLIERHVHARNIGPRAGYTALLLRSLAQATYSPRNIGHHGLKSSAYCHFTSPIRRYPDLICHRGLLSAIGAGEDPPGSSLSSAGEWCSERERLAATLERKGDDIAQAFLLEQQLFKSGWDQSFSGEIVGVIEAGAFIRFGSGFEGFVPVRRLKDDWWEINEYGTMLQGVDTKKALRIGDPASVRVVRIERQLGRVDLELA